MLKKLNAPKGETKSNVKFLYLRFLIKVVYL